MRLSGVISIILVFLLIYRIGEIKNKSKARNIYILIFIGLIIINGFILYDYVQIKSSYNHSTYITYQNLLDRIDDVTRFEIGDSSDLEGFKDSIERLNSQVSLLGLQIDEASLIRGSKKDIISNLDLLTLELHALTNYQDGIIMRQEGISDDTISLYDEFKVKLVDLREVLDVEENRVSRNLFGIAQYRLKSGKSQLGELDTVIESISQINSRLMR